MASTREGYGIMAGDRGAINSSGDLVFTALSNGISQIFKSTGGSPATLLADSTGGYHTFSNVGINDAGQIAFGARLDNFGKQSVFGGMNPATDDLAPDTSIAQYVPGTISADGTVLHTREYRTSGVYYDILSFSKEGVSTEFARSGPTSASPYRALEAERASLSSDGLIAVSGYSRAGDGIYGIFGDATGTQAWVSDRNSVEGVSFLSFYNQGIASNGRLIFTASTYDGQDTISSGVFVTDGAGGFTQIAKEGGLFNSFDSTDGFAERVIIADDGRIAFEASLTSGGKAIYTGSDLATDRLIGTGDSLFGSTVTNVFITPGSYASNGNLLVRYTLADGTHGFASANDFSTSTRAGVSQVQAVPEPASLAALGLGLAALARRRKSQVSR